MFIMIPAIPFLTVPVRVPLLAAPEEFSHQLFALLGVAGCEKPPTNRLNLYWNLKYIDVRSFMMFAVSF